MHLNVHSSTYLNQGSNTTEVSMDRSMDKEGVVHVCNGILLSHEKELKYYYYLKPALGRPRDHHTESAVR